MLNKIKNISLLAIGTSLLFSCGKEPNYKTADSGLKYYFYEDKEGQNAKVGDFVTLNFIYKTSKDSVLRNTWKDGNPIQVEVQPSSFKGGLEDGLQMLSVGDSASFQISADSLFKKTFMAPMPAFIDSGSALTFVMKVLKVQNRAEFEKDQAKMMEERKQKLEQQMSKQKDIDESLIKDFVSKNGIKATRTNSGVYYSIIEKGKGSTPKAGQKVLVNYTGKLLNGSVFDSSVGKEPLEFAVGVGQVIPGWDEGISLLNEGAKAVLVIPSSLAYGPMQMGEKIPPFSVLFFEVELVKIKK
jgi:FKBP-type peptidyl-prolyl cis-trans isomerase FkpA